MLTQPQQQQPRGQQRLCAGETQGCHRRARPSPSAGRLSAPGPVDTRCVGSWQRCPPTVRTRCPHGGRGVPTGNASSPRAAAGSCGARRGCRAHVSLLARTHIREENLAFNHFCTLRAAGGSSKALQRPRVPTPKFSTRRKKPAPALGTTNHSALCRRSCFGETAAQRLGSCLGAGVAAPPAAAPPAILTSAEVT